MDFKDYVALGSLIISIVSASIASYAIYKTSLNAEKQRELQKELDEKKVIIDNRRFFTELWDKMTSLNYIDPQKPIEPHIRKAVNTLQAVAMSWQAGIIDKQMVVIAFGKLYEDLYGQISAVEKVPGTNKSGRDYLTQNRAVLVVLGKIQEELNKQAQILP